MHRFALRLTALSFALVAAAALTGCGEGEGPIALETAEGELVKGGDLPNETCLRRNTNGTTTTGPCNVVCKDLTLYEPNTDAEVDAVSSNGGVCNQAIKRAPSITPIRGGGGVIVR
jgi:hypothetical protein